VTFSNNKYTEKPPNVQKTKLPYILKHTKVLQAYFGTLQEILQSLSVYERMPAYTEL